MKSILKSFIFISLLIASSSMAYGATVTPSKKYVTRKVTSGAFDAVRTNTSLDIIYTVGPRDIEIYAPDNLMPYIKVTLKGSEIIVNYKEDMNIKSSHKSYVKISAPDVTRFTAASAGDIKIKSDIKLKNEKIDLAVLSAGDIDAMNIEADEISIRTNSAGDIGTGNLKGNYVSLIANSAGDIDTRAIAAAKEAKIVTNSSGDIDVVEVYAGMNINVVTNSAGDIEIGEASAPDISVGSNSAGDIEIKTVKATNVAVGTNSSGNIKLAGICSTASLSSGSSGCIYARGLKATNTSATTRSVGNVECCALKSLNAFCNGSGEIKYDGKPSNVMIEGRWRNKVKQF